MNSVGLDLPEDLVLFVAVCCLKLLLNEARSVLITTEFDNMIINVLGGGQ